MPVSANQTRCIMHKGQGLSPMANSSNNPTHKIPPAPMQISAAHRSVLNALIIK
jgi:hypothetical protein